MRRETALTVAGAMSGTSADGIDVAIVRIFPSRQKPRLRLLAHGSFPFPPKFRTCILASMDAKSASVADLSRLGTRLGMAYADAIETTLNTHKLNAHLAGCHGQTIYHQGEPQMFLGRKLATTWQLLDPSPVAERLRLPVVSDFRPADIAAGGQGAPLVPLLDYELFHDARKHRVLQNLGGIGNMTVLPAGAGPQEIVAFDTGPANMVIDALMQKLLHRPFDRNGAVAALGVPSGAIVQSVLRGPFFAKSPPKTAGREQFGAAFADRFLVMCRKSALSNADCIATATLLTANSLRLAVEKVVRPAMPHGVIELVLSGGGSQNHTLVRMIAQQTAPLGCTILTSDHLGLPSRAKEAVAFALLAWNTWHNLTGNLPSATGARRAVVLGRASHA